MSLIHTKIEFR